MAAGLISDKNFDRATMPASSPSASRPPRPSPPIFRSRAHWSSRHRQPASRSRLRCWVRARSLFRRPTWRATGSRLHPVARVDN